MVVLYHVVALPVLPYAYDGLEPWLSRDSVRLHRVLHERYVARTNTLIRGTPLEGQAVEWVVAAGALRWETHGDPILYEQSAQVANHDFFWRCMKPGGGDASRNIPKRLRSELPAIEDFKAAEAALFGSGWLWLFRNREGDLRLKAMPNADRPPGVPILVIDLWEHAFWNDYPTRRGEWVEAFLHWLVDWDTVEEQLSQLPPAAAP